MINDDDYKEDEDTTAEDEEFARTGVFSFNLNINGKIKKSHLVKKLVKDVEGDLIPAKDLEDHNRN